MKNFIFTMIATFILSGVTFGGECLNGTCNLRSRTVNVTREIVNVPVVVTKKVVDTTRNVGKRTVNRVRNIVR